MKEKLGGMFLLFSVAVLLAGGAAAARGQSASDGFNPNANGAIRVIVVQPDGKVLIGGDFTQVWPGKNGIAPVPRNHIARLNADGEVDLAFNPDVNGPVYSIALQGDGQILAGGFFNNIGGQLRNNIARLNATTGLPDSFDPNANNLVRSIAVQADGRILVGGDFNGANSIGGQTRNYLARLDGITGLTDPTFDPNASALVFSIAIQTDGRILAGGNFTSIGGAARNRIARLETATGLADSFNPSPTSGPLGNSIQSIVVQVDGKILVGGSFGSIGGATRSSIARLDATGAADAFNPNANGGIVQSIAVQLDGRILVGGLFANMGGQARNRIARLNASTGLADSFNPNANGAVYAVAVQADSKILAGGDFTTLTPNGGAVVTRNHIARLETDATLDQTLNLSVIGDRVYAIAVQSDGKILIGGVFTSVLGAARNSIARLNKNGTLDTAFNPAANGMVHFINAIAVQTDGKILVGGFFETLAGQTRNNMARLNEDGTLDIGFDPDANGEVFSIAVQADGEILAGGGFTSIGGQARNRIARLDAISGVADSFDPNANTYVLSIAIQPDGKILVGGDFFGSNSIGGQTRNHIARLDAITGLADSFDPNANSEVDAIALQADGKILVGGNFSGANSIGGAERNRIARLNPDGTADSFDPNASGVVESIAVQADGSIWVGGTFTNIGGGSRSRIARLGSNGFADTSNPSSDGEVHALALQADGKVLVGGQFTFIGAQTRNLFARLDNNVGALQNLAVTQTGVAWVRGGSSPQCARATFESSTDNVNYTPLGDGSADGSAWTLTGLSLPAGQHFYIRARGYYRGGLDNGSESITESVWDPFVVVPTPLPFLNIQRGADADVVLSWATNFTGFTLEANTKLTANVWSVVSPAPAVSGTNNVVTNAASGSARFYRLRQ